MRQRALSARRVLARHGWAIRFMESRTSPDPATLRHHDAVLGCLRNAGFSVRLAAHAFSGSRQLHLRIRAAGAQPAVRHAPPDREARAGVDGAVPLHEYPHLAELTSEHVLQPGYDNGNEFAFGLELILEGLDRASDNAAGGSPRTGTTRPTPPHPAPPHSAAGGRIEPRRGGVAGGGRSTAPRHRFLRRRGPTVAPMRVWSALTPPRHPVLPLAEGDRRSRMGPTRASTLVRLPSTPRRARIAASRALGVFARDRDPQGWVDG